MPFKSEKQRRYLWKNEPRIAKEWTKAYGSKPVGKKKKKGKQMRTVWDIPNNKPSEETKHGKVTSQKPVALFERILNATSKKNQVCLIPFWGSGPECIAAIRTKRNFIAFENNKEHYNIANKRIRDELK